MDLREICFLLQLVGLVSAIRGTKYVPPRHYVTTWTVWSGWSDCGSGCGVQVSKRYRECVGQKGFTVFRVKTEECPGTPATYRPCEEKPCDRHPAQPRKNQCSVEAKHRPLPDHIKSRPWNPYAVDAFPCELFCQPEGFDNFWSFGNVSDGTSCRTYLATDGVCIGGDCVEVGCDGVALSDTQLDMCLICGGGNKTCTHIKDEFREVKAQGYLGYSDVVQIPAGAANIDILDHKNVLATQLYVTENVIALQDKKHFYLLNSFRWYGFNGPLTLAGADIKFYFTRDGEKSVHIIGPIKETLSVMVLQTNPYVHIKYGYWLSNDATRKWRESNNKPPTTTPSPKAAAYRLEPVGDHSQRGKKKVSGGTKANEVTGKKKRRRKRKLPKGQKCLRQLSFNGKPVKFKTKLAKLRYIYCQSEFVGTVTLLNKRRYRGETRYEVTLKTTLRNTMSMAQREYLWRDRACPGIKLKPGQQYFVMVKTKTDMRKRLTRFVIDEDSYARRLTPRVDKMLRAAVADVEC